MQGRIVLLYENETGKCLCDAASRILSAVAVSFGHRFTLPVKACPDAVQAPDDVLDACVEAIGVLAGQADMKCLPDVAVELLCACRVRDLRYTQWIENHALLSADVPVKTVIVQALATEKDALRLAANRAYIMSSRDNLPIMHVPPAGKLLPAWMEAVDGADSLSAPYHAREVALPDMIPMMIQKPDRVGVVLCSPYAGNVVSPSAAVLCGATGMVYDEYIGGQCGMYAPLEQAEVSRGEAANPYGMLRAICQMLREGLKLEREASCVEAAMRNVLQAGWRTKDIALEGMPVQDMDGICELICEQIEVAGEWISNG